MDHLSERFAPRLCLRCPYQPPRPDLWKASAKQIMVDIAMCHGFGVEELLGRSRTKSIAEARQEAMYEVRQRTKLTLPQIGRLFERDHTTIMHGIKAHRSRVSPQAPNNPVE